MKKRIFSLFILTGIPFFKLFAQIPKDVPHPNNNEPIDITNPADIIIYIVLPILCIVLFFIWRNKRKKRSKKD